MNLLDRHVYGELVVDLMPSLLRIRETSSFDETGGCHINVELSDAEAAPLVRAMHRAEAELLLEDADRLTPGSRRDRTPEQRRADALVRVAEALR